MERENLTELNTRPSVGERTGGDMGVGRQVEDDLDESEHVRREHRERRPAMRNPRGHYSLMGLPFGDVCLNCKVY